MLYPTTSTLRPAPDHVPSEGDHFLSDVSLDIPAAETAVPRGRLHGPASPKVWARAWLANERDGTLAEVALECVDAASCVNLIVKLHDPRIPENACIRTESAPFVTEHVVIIKLPNHVTH